ncbi:hypothetical protein NQ317_008429 [Molorchus minor]|uniref:Uncharacterized protein n=1 Tax=Molorchus minor TaxID=1323400 RepID=A0ABQ9IVI5_9CUCU|nr:hypothetical protein NQ317_008429 [Molorchus minor]
MMLLKLRKVVADQKVPQRKRLLEPQMELPYVVDLGKKKRRKRNQLRKKLKTKVLAKR